MPRGKTADALQRAEPSNYNNAMPFAQSEWRKFRPVPLPLDRLHSHQHLKSELHKPVCNTIRNRQHASIRAKPVGNLAIVLDIEYSEIGVFAGFDGTFAVR